VLLIFTPYREDALTVAPIFSALGEKFGESEIHLAGMP
jgi:hypothetical protein